jgi:hypothetical protein
MSAFFLEGNMKRMMRDEKVTGIFILDDITKSWG